MRRIILAAAAALLLLAPSASAQSLGKMLGDDFKNAGADMFSIWASPFDGSKRDWILTAGAFGAFGITMLADQSVHNWAVRNDSNAVFKAIGPVRSGGALYVGKTVVPPILGVYVLGLAFKNQGMRDFVTGCMSAWGAQNPIRKQILYRFIGRDRPYASPTDPQKWAFPGDKTTSDDNSFPGGHFANAVSCATFWNKRFDTGIAAPAVYAIAGAVGIGRIADKGHWVSDQVIGGILGYAVGSEIARRSLARRDAMRTEAADLQLSPTRIGLSFKF